MHEMICIGTGPGPKNVLSTDERGRRVVYSYRAWKALPKGARVSDQDQGVYIVAGGIVQQFKKDGEWKPVVTTNVVNGQNVSSFTMKAFGPQQALLSVTLWSEYEHLVPHIVKGAFVSLEGKLRQETKNGVTYNNVSASQIAVLTPVTRQEREVANAVPAEAPAAAAAPAEAAQAAAPAPAAGATIF